MGLYLGGGAVDAVALKLLEMFNLDVVWLRISKFAYRFCVVHNFGEELHLRLFIAENDMEWGKEVMV